MIETLKSMGVNPQPVFFPDSVFYPIGYINLILTAESAAAFDELTRTNRDDLIERQDRDFWPNSFRTARMTPAVEYINANRYRYQLCKKMYDFMNNFDVLIVPTFMGRQLAITNLTGNPAVAMPIVCWPISRGAGTACVLDLNARSVARFQNLSHAGLTAFFAFEVTARAGGKQSQVRFVLNLPLHGAPADRQQRLLRSLLQNQGQVLRFLLLLLSDSGTEMESMLRLTRSIGTGELLPWRAR